MTWLKCSDDEVAVFHPEFELIANQVLWKMGLASTYCWKHHLRSSGVSVVPDFVLINRSTQRWVLIVEIKRTKSSVFSERNQVQAKGYAEANKPLFASLMPVYFCVSNLESTLLFALNGNNPPKECKIANMTFDSGDFNSTPKAKHQYQLSLDLEKIIFYTTQTAVPEFDVIWPRIARNMVNFAAQPHQITFPEPQLGMVPDVVRSYFAGSKIEEAWQNCILQCLATDYFRGILIKFSHPKSHTIPQLSGNISSIAKAIDALQKIDFSFLFEDISSSKFRSFSNNNIIKNVIEIYLGHLNFEDIGRHALMRSDALEFPDILNSEMYPIALRDAKGKIQTDPELALLLATLAITSKDDVVFDPGCGDGNLLSAAYDVLSSLGCRNDKIISQIIGCDADLIAAKIAGMRLVLKEPYTISPGDILNIKQADMFSSPEKFSNVNVVLMNPPFKRYESQDVYPIPKNLRKHYNDAIRKNFENVETDNSQSNIYNLYVEFVIKAAPSDTILGIVLDNKWYHNKTSRALRALLMQECSILGVIEYPHDAYFTDWKVSTSILLAKKGQPSKDHRVNLVRTLNPRTSDFFCVNNAFKGKGSYPPGWNCQTVPQHTLPDGSWKNFFSRPPYCEYIQSEWPTLSHLFAYTRRGSLAKEGGGIAIYEFPFNRTNYGPKRLKKIAGKAFQTTKGEKLSNAEQKELLDSAALIPQDFRGYAINHSDMLDGYYLSLSDITREQTLESPLQRRVDFNSVYFAKSRAKWSSSLASVARDLRNSPVAKFIFAVESIVGLDSSVLQENQLWSVLREPYAGELIIPRKIRVGHRVHINPFAYDEFGRQIRLSSNFLSYSMCIATDEKINLSRQDSVDLIAAFLMSSFGQLQFEKVANNREGARCIEQHHVSKIQIFDPRWVRESKRIDIINAFRELPYPLPTDIHPSLQGKLRSLDELFADEIVNRNMKLDKQQVLEDVWELLFEWIENRKQ